MLEYVANVLEVGFEGEVVAGEPDYRGVDVFELNVMCGWIVLPEGVFYFPCGLVVGLR